MNKPYIKVLWAQKTELPAGWENCRTQHIFYHLYSVYGGNCTFICDNQTFSLSAGEAILIPPHVIHEIPKEQHTLLTSIEVKFELNNSYIEENLLKHGPVIKITPFIDMVLHYVIKCWTHKDPQIRNNVDYMITAMLLSLFIDDLQEPENTSKYIETGGYDKNICQIISFIEENYDSKLNISKITENTGLNKNYLCNRFKMQTGHTMIEYLNYVRICNAARHFYYADVPIIDVALYSGFTNATHFNRVFRMITGTSPSIFRKYFKVDYLHSADTDERTIGSALFEKTVELKICSMDEAFYNMKELGRIAEEYDKLDKKEKIV